MNKFLKKKLHRFLKTLGYHSVALYLISEEKLGYFLKGLIPLEIKLERVGSDFDGGYLIPKLEHLPTLVFSPGVFNNDSFELFFAKKGVKCFLADYSVESNPTSHPNIIFEKKFIGRVHNSEIFISLDDWVNKNSFGVDSGFLLQMDIEGWEYNNLINVSVETLRKFDILCIEFHDFDNLRFKHSFIFFELIFAKLLSLFNVVHLHPNNCCGAEIVHNYNIPRVIEITFLNKSISISHKKVAKLIHELDMVNVKERPPIGIESWLR